MENKSDGFSALVVVAIVLLVAISALVVFRIYVSGQQSSSRGATPTDEGKNLGYVVIKEWGVRFKASGLEGVQYFKPSQINSDSLTFTTKALANLSSRCSQANDGIILGLLTRGKQPDPQYGGEVAKVGDYYYQYHGPQAACSQDYTLESNTVTSLTSALKSLEAE